MSSHPTSQLGLFDTAATECADVEAEPRASTSVQRRLPAREEARPLAAERPVSTGVQRRHPSGEEVLPLATEQRAGTSAEDRRPVHERDEALPLATEQRASSVPESRLPAREEALPLAADLARRLSSILGLPVHLRLTDNRATLVSFRRGEEGLRLRIHHLFLGAPDAVVQAMAAYAGRADAQAGEVLESYAHAHNERVRRERRPGKPLRTRGRCFDLQAIFTRLNASWFDGRVQVDVGWARKPAGTKRRSIHVGGYDARLREIRIHPALDRPHVPAFVVDYLVFHAMLHADLDDGTGNEGRCAPEHTSAFREREALFPLRDTAQRWLGDNHASLLRGR
ncbi:hypothetical protein MXAN_7050 [Myxococcus xanthus DK 1622]|uniref:SprT-like domain-containing protein n=1 Tax=Myxococcus xanthus (strain DK1622) TaxID=246197 RepID=Q1CWR0_MYXXD|nr:MULTISPECIES: hypothetical protein [Myxococcus]ABF91397.1 hypothetical protein MXAN_7050 [Myxococcus xanthus DK 1622]NOJ52785.1 hypothetical protein [Myxococcus xanthus]QPM79326.1 hypothetical protein I5Q59_34700 [Myxococcus xanthus]QVW68405.1 hypothetical protein JTM82_02230 [Myxococcus xanthus DZ2]QZZ54656.1 hypothetical protein MyxoNM_36025 [Myxococcus xanthus]